ncbi:adenylate/guanylate cyclase domain-containing protein [Mycolicibacterium sp. lyk4-40-TYG-92]|jgi:class 3 adenylate cyclase|uniref:adenylate/guanylate cyclase domain-containing protein n=1 Tax=Mycolicibacterium sp. lyk4-40-TYG-92 TaxID=3040295 RepID=UPI002549CC58|nr:adenylate/guanylate cyclase domain-containing protein [Mycolicibacterium sp. lyk4-40-TYG-92]
MRFQRRQLLSRVSIQSKLVVMLVLCTIIAATVVGVIGFRAGRASLRDSVLNRLTELRQSQSRELKDQLSDLKNSMIIYARGAHTQGALAEFTAGFDALADKPISPAQSQSITDYYTNTFLKEVQQASGAKLNVDQLLPRDNAQRYLQANYTAVRKDDDTAVKVDDAHDGSIWSVANARYQDFFRQIVNRFEFQDAILLDNRGNMVYTAYKDVDLGTNILTGPYSGSKLRGAYEKAMSANSVDYVGITDFEIYQPAENQPTAWMITPIVTAGRAMGALALQFPVTKINRLMTFDKRWKESGLGNTGEVFLVGPDDLMRSDSRMFLQDQQTYKSDVVAAGTPADVADRAIELGGTTLVQPVPPTTNRQALRGESGTRLATDYLGHEVLLAYAPITIPDAELHWTIIGKIDTAEAFQRETAFTRTIVLTTVGIIFVVCIAAMFLAQLFVRPIRRLEAGAQRISAGDYNINVPVETRDEIGELTEAFNEMSRSLTVKEELLVEQRKENAKLLALLMPEPVVERYQQGEEIVPEEHQNVTVIFTEVIGLDRLQAQLTSQGLAVVTELERQFDAAADNLGIERVRAIRNGYLGSCGLNTPRLDNVRRTVDFALECQRIIDRFNSETGNHLGLRAGIDTGTVSSGLGGEYSVVYDMWGAAVNVAYQVKSGSPQPGIDVTDRVYQALQATMTFTSAGTMSVDGQDEPIWRLVAPQ